MKSCLRYRLMTSQGFPSVRVHLGILLLTYRVRGFRQLARVTESKKGNERTRPRPVAASIFTYRNKLL